MGRPLLSSPVLQKRLGRMTEEVTSVPHAGAGGQVSYHSDREAEAVCGSQGRSLRLPL